MKGRHFFRGAKLSTVGWGEGLLTQRSQAVLVVAADLHDEGTEERNQRSPSTRNGSIEHISTKESTRGRNANTKEAREITRRRMTTPGGDQSRDENARDIEVEVHVLESIHSNGSAHFDINSGHTVYLFLSEKLRA
mmetsp:Transcript_615/g.1388  ORF Transcript_615/g.1388 Transcript_615/m.1388 type:complete len:136 (+) Transcript_615:698-1105(+)